MNGSPRRQGSHEGRVPARQSSWAFWQRGAKRHLADLRTRSGLSTEQLTYAGRDAGWLVIPSRESQPTDVVGH